MRLPLLFSLAIAACALATSTAVAQTAPVNDQCQNAALLTSGTPVFGTVAGAADDIPGLIGCQIGSTNTSYPDAWYAFVATGTTLTYEMISAGTNDSISLYLFDGTCTNLTLRNSACGMDTLRGIHNGLTLGATYYLATTATAGGGFVLSIQLGGAAISPAQDCNDAVVLSSLTTFGQLTSNAGSGLDPAEVDPINSCWGSGGERQSKWYRFTAGATGTLEFSVNPLDPNDDYDWAVWDVTTDALGCTTKGNAIACNWSGSRGATGLSYCPTMEPGYMNGNTFDNTTTGLTGSMAPITVQAGRVYALLVDNFSTSSTGFNLTFGGACGPRQPTDPQPVPLGLAATFTSLSRPGMTAEFTPTVQVASGLAVTYHWSFGDGNTSTAIAPTHTYATAGTYFTTLEVTDLLGTMATYGRSINVNITGIADDVARAARLTLSPNPAQQQVRLTLAEPVSAKTTAQLYNSLGRLIRTVALPTGATTADFDLNGLRAGVYSVRVGGEVRRLVVAE